MAGQANPAFELGSEEQQAMPKPADPELQKQLLNSDSSIGSSVPPPEEYGIISSIKRYPKGVFFMLGNEFCERFSFYGMRAVLTLYFVTIHDFSESRAKLLFHLFVAICYFTPLLGSILADGFLGRFKVILYGSVIYCVGHILLTSGAIPGLPYYALMSLDFSGLIVIALATGGIKPCVSAFAADQFPSDMVRERETFFSFFYFAINAGALLSKIVTPILRGRVQCMGENHCFPLAFGLPAVLMFIALVLFIFGRPFYIVRKTLDGNIVGQVCSLIWYAFTKRVKAGRTEKEHWLDHADDKFPPGLIDDVRQLLKLATLFLPVVLFWALFDQMGSTWVLQARKMDGNLGYLTILPDQMSVSNPFLVIMLVPFITAVLYPIFHRYQFLDKPLKRMLAGGILAALSFVIAGFLQLYVNRSAIDYPNGRSRFFVRNNLDCTLNLQNTAGNTELTIESLQHSTVDLTYFPSFSLENCQKYALDAFQGPEFKSDPKTAFFVSVQPEGAGKAVIRYHKFPYMKTKNGVTKFLFLLSEELDQHLNSTIMVAQNGDAKFRADASMDFAEVTVQPGIFGSKNYDLDLRRYDSTDDYSDVRIASQVRVDMGPVRGVSVWTDGDQVKSSISELVPKNDVCLLWQLPQYIVITIGEIFLSVTGMEFSYSQAPASMKSVLQAFWLLTVAIGNMLALVISGSDMIQAPHVEFFVYAALMGVVMILFAVLARNYEYVTEADVSGGALRKQRPVELQTVSDGRMTEVRPDVM